MGQAYLVFGNLKDRITKDNFLFYDEIIFHFINLSDITMAITYQKAPISELICGVIFTNNILAHELILFELLFELKDEYPDINTQPPIFEEELQDYKVFTTVNTAATGFSLYRLSSDDKKFMIQIQQNLVLVNL